MDFVTDKKDKIEQDKLELELVTKALPQVICLVDKKGKVIFVNKTIEDWNIAKRSDIENINIHKLFHKNCKNPFCYLNSLWKKTKLRIKEQQSFEIETEDEILHKFLNIQICPITSNNPVNKRNKANVVIIFNDITDKRVSNDMWQRYEFVVNAFKEYMTLIDKKYIYKAVNQAYCEAHERSSDKIVGNSVSDVWGDKIFKEKIKSHLDLCFKGKVIYYQAWFTFKALGERYWDVACYPYIDNNGNVPYIVVVSRDITDKMQAEEELIKQKTNLQKETTIRKTMLKIAGRLSRAKGKNLEVVLNEVCKKICKLLNIKKVYICLDGEIIANSLNIITLPWNRKSIFYQIIKLDLKNINGSNNLKIKLLTRSRNVAASIIVFGKKNKKFSESDRELLNIIGNTISLALEIAILEDRSKKLKTITQRVIFIDGEEFQRKLDSLNGNNFKATYLVADTVESVSQKIDQTKLQRELKSIAVKNGAIWGNAWGDMIHMVFADYFKKTIGGDEVSAYKAAISICNKIKKKLGYSMRVGIASGKINVNKDTIQMDQLDRSRIIEMSSIAQEGRVGVSTLQKPSGFLKNIMKGLGYEFKYTKDLVRGTLKSVWKLYPEKKEDIKKDKTFKTNDKSLSYETTLKILLTKGVCGHGHLEGSVITPGMSNVIKKVGKLYSKDENLQQKFYKLTGKDYKEILKSLTEIESWGESRKKFDFVKHFLPWLYLMKLGEASSPDLIYELTKEQLKYELKIHSGFTREISPTVWLEMGLPFDKCIEAFVKACEDSFRSETIIGPIDIGVAVKRQFLTKNISQKLNPFLKDIKYPYIKCLELIFALKQSKVQDLINLYVNTIDIASINPLFNFTGCPDRSLHTELFYKEAKNLGIGCHVHLLEELVDQKFISKKESQIKELYFIIDLFNKLRIKNARFIHLAYWPKTLPLLDKIKQSKHEIAVCETSTRMLGFEHRPRSPFLLQNKKVIEGVIFDSDFPLIVLSTDDSGPFGIRNVWEEYLIVHSDIVKWHGRDYADTAFFQFLRSSYKNLEPKEISREFKLNQKAVEWMFAYDIYQEKLKEIDKETSQALNRRFREIIQKRNIYVKR